MIPPHEQLIKIKETDLDGKFHITGSSDDSDDTRWNIFKY